MNALNQSTTSLDDTRREMLFKLLKERYIDQDVPDYYIKQEAEFYLNSLDSGKPITTLRPQVELTDALSINNEMEEFEIDIFTIFHQLNHVSQRINQHQKLNESIINDIQMRINKSHEQIEELGYLVRSQSAHSVFYETFLDYKSKEKDTSYYTDRDGRPFAPAYELTIDAYQDSLKLPVVNVENKLVNFAGVKIAEVNITKQIGSGFIRTKNPEHSIDKAIDTSMETYWNESILVDEPLEVNLGLDYYGVEFGATCELEVTFDYITKVNEITLTPFTEYPLEVVSILVYDNDNNEFPFELVSPTAIRRNIESTGVISYQFQDVVAKRIKLLINQQHYTKKDILVSTEDKTLIDAWLKEQDHIEVDEGKLFKPVEQDQHLMYPFWKYLQEYMKDKSIVDEIERYKDLDLTNKVHLSKYEYQYGLYNLAINSNEYFYEGVYVTKPLANTNVHIVQLEATEEHPILEELKIQVTSVEYYITDIEHPTDSDWNPILPTNTEFIYSERLFPEFRDGAYKADTRFGIQKLGAVKSNGEDMLAHDDYGNSGRVITIKNYNPSKIYTIDYRPLPTAYSVDFLEKYTNRFFSTERNAMVEEVSTRQFAEEFNSLEPGNLATLSYFPFWDRNLMNLVEKKEEEWNPTYLSNPYLPFKVRLILPDGEYVDQRTDRWDNAGTYITNKTDYHDLNRSLLEPFNGQNYQYRIEKNMIKFNTKFPEGTRIMVEYPYLTGPIRMKTIMRRNLHEVEGLTPFLHDYKLIFQSLL